MSNIITSKLQLTKVLMAALTAYKRAILPLTAFSTVFRNVPLLGNNKVDVPFYNLASTTDVQTRSASQDYFDLAAGSFTDSREIIVGQEQVVGISWTQEDRARQPLFDPVKHGTLKGEALAFKILMQIFGGIRSSNFGGNRTIAPVTPGNFDVSEVGSLGQIATEDRWPETPAPSLILNPAAHFNLVQQPNVLQFQQSGSTDALRQAEVGRIFNFDEYKTAGLAPNNDASGGTAFTVASSVLTATGHGLTTGDQVTVTTTNTLPTGLAIQTYYYAIVVDANTLKLASSYANAIAGTNISLSGSPSGTNSVVWTENLIGIASHPSAILAAFAPIPPTEGMRRFMVDYEIIDDPESGLTLEYRHLAQPNKGLEGQFISVNFGYAFGLQEALKLIAAPATYAPSWTPGPTTVSSSIAA